MPKYRYQAADTQGNPVSGELEAAGLDEARQKLAAQGFDAERAQLTEIPEKVSGRGRLSADEAAEVGGQLAQFAKAGLPLAAGLRAMADEIQFALKGESRRFLVGMLTVGSVPAVVLVFCGLYLLMGPWSVFLGIAVAPLILLPFYLASLSRHHRVARVLRRVARQLDAGTSLDAALGAQRKLFPIHVRGLVRAGLETGRLAEALEEFVDVEKGRIELRRRVWLTLAYPFVLVGMLFLLFSGIFAFIVPQFKSIFEDFGCELPPLTQMVLWMSGPGFPLVVGVPALVVAVIILLSLMRRTVWARRVLYAVPLVGPTWRYAALSNFSRLMAMLLAQEVPLPRALRLTAAGLQEGDLSAACRGAAEEVEAGRSFSECLADFWQFPPTLRPLVEWAERTNNPVAAFRAGTEMFEGRVQVYVPLLQTVLPPLVFLLVLVAAVFLVLVALFMPLISLISSLT